jgi:hypothetical protein
MSLCSSPLNRRQLFAAAASFLATARRGDSQSETTPVRVRGTARACIFVNLNGGASHLDTWDPKDAPWNPTDIDLRAGPGGIVLSNTLFPELSRYVADLCILRSVSSWENAHDRGQFYLQTAHASNPAFVAETPHIGAVVALEKSGSGPLPPFLAPNGGAGQGATFLGGRMQPMGAPANQGGLTTIEHNFYGPQSQARFNDKFAFLNELDGPLRRGALDAPLRDHATFYESARQLMYDQAIASVFRFSADDTGRYGNTNLGRAAIVARNAVRANNGTVFVNLTQNGWDTHQNMFDRLYAPNQYTLCNELDRALAALVEDLKASGDFDSTLIVVMSEFGRTPGVLNARGGRDHHKDAMSVLLMGGGVRGGRAIGVTDSEGARVIEPGWSRQRPIYFEDLAATIYSALGINWTKRITDTPTRRLFEYVPYATEGRFTSVDEVFG